MAAPRLINGRNQAILHGGIGPKPPISAMPQANNRIEQPAGSFPDLKAIRQLVVSDMDAVDALIERKLASRVTLINQLAGYIIGSGGKRLRPMLVLLSAGACGYQGKDHIQLAAIIEFIHTATLLHDDVVDASELRRGRETANALWGNEASVLVGDFLYSRAFQMMVEIDNMKIMTLLADTTNTIAEGEVMQLLNCHDPDTAEELYLTVIRSKTAKLFEAASQLGAVITDRPDAEIKALARYGRCLGTSFQLIDDVLDYSGNREQTGKNLGDDLAEGKPTLPLIHVMQNGRPDQVATVRDAIEKGGLNQIDAVLNAIESTGAIAYTHRLAQGEARRAIDALQGMATSPFMAALHALADFAVQRGY